MLGKRSGGKKSARGYGGDSQGRPKSRMSGESHEAGENRGRGWKAGAQVNWGESQGSTNGERGRRGGIRRHRRRHSEDDGVWMVDLDAGRWALDGCRAAGRNWISRRKRGCSPQFSG
ncbi:hypothetical protein ASPTUDRAFT_55869 [Aspergillus tubingensis CBS 134.48]|uniref:Uncharacterized protein n=1 Tax=Aspergillus tubingensis (strain CBS 134.48) TaxID=767770 RepID=A0A1L9N3L4_ASPTC|nr:hypothetical protein ASPTUDRAFT_55869 [Aspergillus tubingensis CBS 134.48]